MLSRVSPWYWEGVPHCHPADQCDRSCEHPLAPSILLLRFSRCPLFSDMLGGHVCVNKGVIYEERDCTTSQCCCGWVYYDDYRGFVWSVHNAVCVCLQVMDHDTIQGIAVKFETTPSEIARINKKHTLTFSIFPGDVSCYIWLSIITSILCAHFLFYVPCCLPWCYYIDYMPLHCPPLPNLVLSILQVCIQCSLIPRPREEDRKVPGIRCAYIACTYTCVNRCFLHLHCKTYSSHKSHTTE